MGYREDAEERERQKKTAEIAPWFIERIGALQGELAALTTAGTLHPEVAAFLRECVSKALRYHAKLSGGTNSSYRDED